MITTLERPITETADEKLERGISAILRALEDARTGTLVCDCPDSRCVARRKASQ